MRCGSFTLRLMQGYGRCICEVLRQKSVNSNKREEAERQVRKFTVNTFLQKCCTRKLALRYLQATKSLKLVFLRDSDFHLHGKSDADWSRDDDDRLSTPGYFLKLGFKRKQLAGKPRSSRMWRCRPAKLSTRVWQQLCKRQPSCDPSSPRWAISICRQHALTKTAKGASIWRTTP